MRTLDVEELAPDRGPAGGLLDAASVVEVMEACVAIGLHGPAEVGQMATRMLALAIRSVSEPDTWRGRICCRAVVTDVGPQTPGFGLAHAGSEHRHRGIVGVDLGGGDYMLTHLIDQRA